MLAITFNEHSTDTIETIMYEKAKKESSPIIYHLEYGFPLCPYYGAQRFVDALSPDVGQTIPFQIQNSDRSLLET